MRRIWVAILIVIIFTAAVLTGCAEKKGESDHMGIGTLQSKVRYTDITPKDAKKRLDTEKGIVLLDVRTKEEYAEGHIPGSKLIPVDVLEKEALSQLPDKNTTLFVYCRSGRRSSAASEILVKLGYTQVFNLGGIIDWPYETESGAN